MQTTVLHTDAGQTTHLLVLAAGEEAVAMLTEFVTATGLGAAHFTAVGAFSRAVVGFFDVERKDYRRLPVGEQVEVLSLVGNVARGEDGRPKIHAHVVLGTADGSARGGHLLEGHVKPTLEVVLVQSPPHLQRRMDPRFGLALIDVGGTSRT
jgi:predicted DNA-binding protein with PD1-like motif